MKYITLLLIIGMGLINTHQLTSQQDGGKKEKLQQMKIAFITETMDLSTEDAQRFWPIYNKYQDEFASLRQRKERGEKGEREEMIESMSEQEAKTLYNEHLEREEKKLALTQQMVKELEQFFTSKQILNYLTAEEKFKRKVLSKVKEKMKENNRPKAEEK